MMYILAFATYTGGALLFWSAFNIHDKCLGLGLTHFALAVMHPLISSVAYLVAKQFYMLAIKSA